MMETKYILIHECAIVQPPETINEDKCVYNMMYIINSHIFYYEDKGYVYK